MWIKKKSKFQGYIWFRILFDDLVFLEYWFKENVETIREQNEP